jgi:DNA mismatch repair protein MutL
MSDLIKLLPDHIANQIAAGEVVQRPASVVKELVENAVDAGATKINLIVKDGGRTLVQVIDNGSGMSPTDARMSFERHATSKIKNADDLFLLHTKGFRGEALASIAAVAHVVMRTKQQHIELGTEIVMEGSKIVSQEPATMANGTSIAVKNLFFNVPARRNFLGTNITEFRKILEDFLRIALVHTNIEMTFHHNNDEIYNLPAQGLRQRIVQIYGTKFNERLVPVNEETDLIKIKGFVVKPTYAKTSKDQSYFFVNDRYFNDRYFNHAIVAAYEGLIPSGKIPPYFLYFEVPTNSIDVNVHPTKTEIKFEENKAIYAIIRSAVKQALGQFNIAPSLDFDRDTTFDYPAPKEDQEIKMPEIKVNPNFNPFKPETATRSYGNSNSAIAANGFGGSKAVNPSVWENFYENIRPETVEPTLNNEVDFPQDLESPTFSQEISDGEEHQEEIGTTIASSMNNEMAVEQKKPTQIHEKYILTSIKNGFLLIDQYRAHCRILYDQFMAGEPAELASQKMIFPEELEIAKTEIYSWQELIPALNNLGFELILEGHFLKIHGVPVSLKNRNPQRTLTDIFEEYSNNHQMADLNPKSTVARAMASAMGTKAGTKLTSEEMMYLTDALFGSTSPQISPHGKKIIETFTLDELTKRFSDVG